MEWTEKAPEYGDIVRTKVSFYYHYGIFVNENRIIQFGLPDNVNRPADEVKVLATDIYTFIGKGELEVAELSASEKAKRRKPKQAVALAESRIGEGGYNILHNNCEHFVYDCVMGEKNSDFISNLRKNLRKKLGKND